MYYNMQKHTRKFLYNNKKNLALYLWRLVNSCVLWWLCGTLKHQPDLIRWKLGRFGFCISKGNSTSLTSFFGCFPPVCEPLRIKKGQITRSKKDQVKLVWNMLTLKVSWCWCEIDLVSSSTDSFRPKAYQKKKENNGKKRSKKMIWTSSHLGERGQIKTALISSHTDNYFISRTWLFDRGADRWTSLSKYSLTSAF